MISLQRAGLSFSSFDPLQTGYKQVGLRSVSCANQMPLQMHILRFAAFLWCTRDPGRRQRRRSRAAFCRWGDVWTEHLSFQGGALHTGQARPKSTGTPGGSPTPLQNKTQSKGTETEPCKRVQQRVEQ